jgi:hypothetical protein
MQETFAQEVEALLEITMKMMNDYKMEELIPIVAELTRKYTSNESSSISYDTARMLMNSVIYCINELNQTDDGIVLYNGIMLSERPEARTAYDAGYQLVVQKTIKAKVLYDKIIATDFIHYGSQCYYDTVIKGMPAFFLYYDAKFKPQDHLLTLDYPTIKSVHKQCGVDAIYSYLEYINQEQKFLRRFSYNKVVNLLSRYHEDYEELFINLCSIVLRYCIGCMVVGKKVGELELDVNDFCIIRDFVSRTSLKDLQDKLCNIIHTLIKVGYDDDEELYKYLTGDVEDFSVELTHAVNNDCMEMIFPVIN